MLVSSKPFPILFLECSPIRLLQLRLASPPQGRLRCGRSYGGGVPGTRHSGKGETFSGESKCSGHSRSTGSLARSRYVNQRNPPNECFWVANAPTSKHHQHEETCNIHLPFRQSDLHAELSNNADDGLQERPVLPRGPLPHDCQQAQPAVPRMDLALQQLPRTLP